MSLYPLLEINLATLAENSRRIVRLCAECSVQVVGITKCVLGNAAIAAAFRDGGIRIIGDARVENLKRIRRSGLDVSTMLIRPAMISEVASVARVADVSLNTEVETLRALSRAAAEQSSVHRVLLMVDVGDRREGILPQDLPCVLRSTRDMRGIEVAGIAANVGCFGGILPTNANHRLLADLALQCRHIGFGMETVSTGGTATLELLENRSLPKGINQVRVGEGILLGRNPVRNRTLEWLQQDAFRLKAEIVEIKAKPSLPEGEIGHDAFGKAPKFKDRGRRKRAVLAIGRQDVDTEGLVPLAPGIEILGGSSDQVVADVTDSSCAVAVGDVLEFSLNYPALLRAMTSPFVRKRYVRR